MRGGLAWIVAIVAGVVVVIVVTAAIGTRDDRGETVSAGQWAQSVCGAIGVWRGEIEATVEDIRTPGDAASEEPQSETTQGRTGFVRKGLERAVLATETLVEGIDNAGVPDTAQGEEAAARSSNWADDAARRSRGRRRTRSTRKRTLWRTSIDQLTRRRSARSASRSPAVQTVCRCRTSRSRARSRAARLEHVPGAAGGGELDEHDATGSSSPSRASSSSPSSRSASARVGSGSGCGVASAPSSSSSSSGSTPGRRRSARS